jgi:magnesium-transporting ATPase (P-type)
VCCFDKTGTITAEDLVLEGVVGLEYVLKSPAFHELIGFHHIQLSSSDRKRLVNVKETSRETTLCLAAAHALVRLDDGTVVGDPMEKTALESLEWNLGKGMLCMPTVDMVLLKVLRGCYFTRQCPRPSPHTINHSPSFPVFFIPETYVDCFGASWRQSSGCC